MLGSRDGGGGRAAAGRGGRGSHELAPVPAAARRDSRAARRSTVSGRMAVSQHTGRPGALKGHPEEETALLQNRFPPGNPTGRHSAGHEERPQPVR